MTHVETDRQGPRLRVRTPLLLGMAAYLAAGLVFAVKTQPQQMWVCRDPTSPSGEMTYGGVDSPPRDDCHPTVTNGDRATWIASATPLWLPLVALKGLSNAAGAEPE